jgi:hypothetical protein
MIRLHQIDLFFVPHTKCPFPVVLQVGLVETRSKLRLKLLGTVTSHLIENRRVEPEIARCATGCIRRIVHDMANVASRFGPFPTASADEVFNHRSVLVLRMTRRECCKLVSFGSESSNIDERRAKIDVT